MYSTKSEGTRKEQRVCRASGAAPPQAGGQIVVSLPERGYFVGTAAAAGGSPSTLVFVGLDPAQQSGPAEREDEATSAAGG